ncbi:hypothetical protein AOC36_00635 [Erysipelothrix larvae]|uniref:N-acetyltransferase domain-containing protein n=1 Tax=Erysipelothrix larvae TaxID=1514105 RepID=A0A109UGE9_9FIRM|nr:GNAT family N-acetyltransferase [Erysipelothrix larvae]AMC92550.1 hypothetical protein AOC36_00635 [Erysipelothrix larvae]
MLDKARSEEKNLIHKYWKEAFHHQDGGSINAYFNHHYKDDESYVYRGNDGSIISSAQVRSKVLSLHDKKIRVSYITGLLTRPEYQGQGYMKKFMEALLDELSQKDIVTLLSAYEPKIFSNFGFEPVIEDYEYNINARSMFEFGIDGILLNPEAKDLKRVYETFTQHFTGYFVRTLEDFELLKKEYAAKNGKIVGLTVDNILVGYAAYIQHNGYVEVKECCYDKSGTLMQLMSFVSRGQTRVILTTTTAEQIRKLYPESRRVKRPFLLGRINDQELFERLYHIRILSAYSAFHAYGKPLFNRDNQ